uniref:Uncharacterized protein n=1 Tax=Knipowitschia caucasica TaxID=637954 RepID=A0AAV2LLW6_KNICA
MGSPGSKLTEDKEQDYTPSRYKLLRIVTNAQKFMQCCWPCRTKISGEEKPVNKELQERAKRLKIRNELRQNGLGVATSVKTANLSQHGASGVSSFAPEIKTKSDSATISRAASQASIASALEQVKEILDEAEVTVARSSSLSKDEAEVLVSKLSYKSEADAVSIYSMMLDEMDEIRHRNSLDSDERNVSADIEKMEKEAACHLEKLVSMPNDIQEGCHQKLSQDISNGQHKDVNEALQQVVVHNMSPRNSIGAWKFGRKKNCKKSSVCPRTPRPTIQAHAIPLPTQQLQNVVGDRPHQILGL